MSLPRVILRKNLARAVRAGHPWIYRDAVTAPPGLKDGDVVLVATSDGRVLARGFWTATTPIAVRVVATDARDDLATSIRARLEAALATRLAALDTNDTNAFRWVHGEADRLPGMHLDVYGRFATVRFDGSGARAFYRDVAPVLLAVGAPLGIQTVIERRRGTRATGGAAEADDEVTAGGASRVLVGPEPPAELEVSENGLRFGVDLARGQKGGLFLDQRENRARIRARARGLRVLNLFGYTGGFSIYATAGGATATTTVDVAAGAIAAARANFTRNALPLDSAELVAGDAFDFLDDARKKARTWDLVISDPPSFAPSRRAVDAALHAYRRLHGLAASVTAAGGLLVAASCSSHVDETAFLETIDAGCAEARRRFERLEMHGAGVDHPVVDTFPEGRYLKLAIGRV